MTPTSVRAATPDALVIDASVVVDVLLRRDAEGLAEWLLSNDPEMHAPHLLDLEVVHAMRGFVRRGEVAASAGAAVLERLHGFAVWRDAHESLLPRIWQLRNSVSAYDASYLALAEILDVPLVTRDARLSRIAGHSATVLLV